MPEFQSTHRILVMGGSGFLGARLLSILDSREREVLCVARKPANRLHAPRESIREVSADLSDPGKVESLFQLLHPTGVLLVAALSRVGDCEREPDLARRLNSELPGEVARVCATRGLRMVFTSTDLVFDGEPPRQTGYVESDPTGAAHEYGRSKAAGERAVLEANPDALVVRLPLLCGASGERGLGASDSLLAALNRGESPGLFTDEWRTPLDVGSAARALVELYDGQQRGCLHVAGPERLSRLELGRQILESAHRRAEFNRLRPVTRAELGFEDRPRDVSLDSSRARALLSVELTGVPAGLDSEP